MNLQVEIFLKSRFHCTVLTLLGDLESPLSRHFLSVDILWILMLALIIFQAKEIHCYRSIFFRACDFSLFWIKRVTKWNNILFETALMPCPSMGLKLFWTVQIIFVEYQPIILDVSQFVLVRSKLFWTGPNYNNSPEKSNLYLTKIFNEWSLITTVTAKKQQ